MIPKLLTFNYFPRTKNFYADIKIHNRGFCG